MQTIAAIDVGSNAIRLLIGKVDDNGQAEALEALRVPVRLGNGTFSDGIINETTIQEAVKAFDSFQKVIHDFGVSQFRAVSTSAMREAVNKDIIIDRIQRASGIPVEIISGEEEARLIQVAVARVVDIKNKTALLIDIGGGSMETTLSVNGSIIFAESYKIGTVRLLSQLNQPDRPNASVEDLVREYLESPRKRIRMILENQKVDLMIGTGGNVEELGELAHSLFGRKSNREISVEDLEALVVMFGKLSYEERVHKLGLRPDRADVIVPAAILLKAVADETKLHEIMIPHAGLKEGVLWDLAEEITMKAHPSRNEQVWVSIQRLGRKYSTDEAHARHVAELAGRLFDQTHELHNLDNEHRLLLEAGAYLHDIGHFISTIDHDKHGFYILTANPIIGLNDAQQAIVANLVRFHRRHLPGFEENGFHSLPQSDRLILIKLLSILRIADALDINRSGRVKDIILKNENNTWELDLSGESDLLLEKWTAEKRKSLFCELFGVTLQIKV